MLNTLDSFMICTRLRAMNFIENFRKDERGALSFVGVLLLIIVIVVLLCVLFRDKISEWFVQMWGCRLPRPMEIS